MVSSLGSTEKSNYFMTVSHKQGLGVFVFEGVGGDRVSEYKLCQNEIQVLKTMVLLC